jgi:hypothetical protein
LTKIKEGSRMSTWESEMTLEERASAIEQLVEYIIEAMDMSALENYAKQQLEEYYNSPEGVEDFNTNYAEMKEVLGTPMKYHGGE